MFITFLSKIDIPGSASPGQKGPPGTKGPASITQCLQGEPGPRGQAGPQGSRGSAVSNTNYLCLHLYNDNYV